MAVSDIFVRGVEVLEQLGLSDVLMPFFLVFTLVFAILQKSHILGTQEEAKKYNIVLSLVMAFAVVIPHVLGVFPAGADVVDIINTALPNIALVIIGLVMVLLLLGLFGAKVSGSVSGGVALAAFIVVAYVFGASAGYWQVNPWFNFLDDPDTQALLVILLIFGLVVAFITGGEKKTAGKGMLDGIKELFTK